MCQILPQTADNAIVDIFMFYLCQQREILRYFYLKSGFIWPLQTPKSVIKSYHKVTRETQKLVPTSYVGKLYIECCFLEVVAKYCFYILFEKQNLTWPDFTVEQRLSISLKMM